MIWYNFFGAIFMRKRIIFSLCTLILGIIIYYLYYKKILSENNEFSILIRNYIPDFLWMMSFYFFSINYSKRITNNYILLTSIYTFTIGLIFELLQLANIVKGTFDIFDIITYSISILFACVVEKYIWRYENEKNDKI